MKKTIFNSILNILLVGVIALFIGRYFYFKPAFVNGEQAPTFSATLANGEKMQLSDLEGNYVLLDFWGSWCRPCRSENPQLVQLYDKYSAKKFKDAQRFEIVSIGIEKNKDRWLRAIRNDGLKWKYHILDEATNMRFFDAEIAGLYEVKQVPTTFLINPKGVIIGVNLTLNEIDKLLEKRLL
ncbi:MAG: TlpA family protein disulfide reductase [Desulfobulbaceae bacterium]|nr:TlpA family protein disulfide reductase [Desulfobulbaceae bacterium]